MAVARIVWGAIVAIVLAVPVVVFAGYDSFRVVKQSLLIAGGVFIATAILVAALVAHLPEEIRRLPRRLVLLAAAIVGWTLIATLVSTNRTLSIVSLLWVVANVAFALATAAYASKRSLDGAVWWPFAGVVVNAVVLFCQVTRIWNPFVFDEHVYEFGLKRIRHTALVGNPNDVGAYFVAPALAALALAAATRGWRRYAALALALAAIFGVVGSETLTALIALAVGAAALGLRAARKASIIAIVALVVVGGATVALYPPLRTRVTETASLLGGGRTDALMSGRLRPYLTAIELWKERPLFGVGPGAFGWHYLETKIEVDRKYGRRLGDDTAMYHEAHNDHLQVLSQTGLPGYALLLAALGIAALPSFRRTATDDARQRFASTLAFPLALSFAVVGMAGFPLELAAPMSVFLFFGALCEAWSR